MIDVREEEELPLRRLGHLGDTPNRCTLLAAVGNKNIEQTRHTQTRPDTHRPEQTNTGQTRQTQTRLDKHRPDQTNTDQNKQRIGFP